MRRLLLLALPIALLVTATPATAADEPWSWPVPRAGLDRTFDPPADQYAAGHRGIDIAAPAGSPVLAVAPGTVTFVGTVAGVQVVTIDHGGVRSTYQPVRARVRRGDGVERGEPIGVLLASPSHCSGPCLHLGRVTGRDQDERTYLDPMDLLDGGRFRLISPDGPPPEPPAAAFAGSFDFDGTRPVDAPITSPYGMRVHPVTGVRKLHDGTDFGAACGTPVHVVGDGRVAATPSGDAYGNRVLVDHGDGTTTAYAHLSSRSVSPGDRVRAGDVIGRVGTTGLSTGCHLHFMVIRGGTTVNPMSG